MADAERRGTGDTTLFVLARRSLDLALCAMTLVILVVVLLTRVVPQVGWSTFIVRGPSMEPAIPLGSAVLVRPIPATDVAVGDVVSIRVGVEHAIFTHRVTRLVTREDGLWLETKGEANRDVDPSLVPSSGLIGRVELAIPFVGYVAAALTSPSGLAFVAGLVGFIVAARQLIGLRSGSPDSVRPRPRTQPSGA